MAGSRWATQDEMAKRCLEKVTEQEHADFVALLDRLVSLPFSYRLTEDGYLRMRMIYNKCETEL